MSRIKYLFLLFFIQNIFAQYSLSDYSEFLNASHRSPVDYVFETFEHSDIVILGERDHRETSQYDLILEIIKDDRFQNIGYVYTEVGVINKTDWGNQILKGNFETEELFLEALQKLYRELDFNPLWDKYNMIEYLKGIYHINKNREVENKITIGFTDIAFDWSGMTKAEYFAFEKEYLQPMNVRDSIMAHNFLKQYKNQKLINGCRKALYIQSRPHAEKIDTIFVSKNKKTVGAYLRDEFKDNVKTIALNWYNWVPKEWKNENWGNSHTIELSNDGLWDAAFELTNNRSVGFDIANTPFGRTFYDYPYHNPKILRYEDIIDGFIFYKPFYEFNCTRGLPGIVDKEFVPTLIERLKISRAYEEHLEYDIEDELYDWEDYRSFECADYSSMKKQMQKWLD